MLEAPAEAATSARLGVQLVTCPALAHPVPCDSAVWAGGLFHSGHGNVARPWAALSVSQAPMLGRK